jgi:hypothetical protein
LKLDPVTDKILHCAFNAIHQNNGMLSEEDIRDLVLKAVRDEEIKNHKFLVEFCTLPDETRKKFWVDILKKATADLPEVKNKKKFLKEFKNKMEGCFNCDQCGSP